MVDKLAIFGSSVRHARLIRTRVAAVHTFILATGARFARSCMPHAFEILDFVIFTQNRYYKPRKPYELSFP